MHSPFRRPDATHLGEMAADAAVELLAGTGIVGLSSRAIAAWLGITPPALTQRAERSELVRQVVVCFTRRWDRWVDVPPWHDVPARLPQDDEEIHGVRVWHALAELARGEELAGHPLPAQIMAQTREDERALVTDRLGHLLDREPSDVEVHATTAVVAGLRLEVAAPEPSLSPPEAAEVLEAHLRCLRAGR